MGWLFPHGASLRSILADRTTGWEKTVDGILISQKCLKHCFRGNILHKGTLWTVWETTYTKDGQQVKPSVRFIGCDLLECRSIRGIRSWGYKDLDESMGPCYYNCPMSYLDMVPVVNQDWRKIVMEHHNVRRKRKGLTFQIEVV